MTQQGMSTSSVRSIQRNQAGNIRPFTEHQLLPHKPPSARQTRVVCLALPCSLLLLCGVRSEIGQLIVRTTVLQAIKRLTCTPSVPVVCCLEPAGFCHGHMGCEAPASLL